MRLSRSIIVFTLSVSLLVSSLPFNAINFVVQTDLLPHKIVQDVVAFSCSPCRRAARELRRARDRVRRELARLRREAERAAKRVQKNTSAIAKQTGLDRLKDDALSFIAQHALAVALAYLPAGQIVTLAIEIMEYERLIQDLIALDADQGILAPLQAKLTEYENALIGLESLPVSTSTVSRVSHIRSAPGNGVQSANVARLKMEQMGQYMATLFFQAIFFQNINSTGGQLPPRRPVTLIYKIGQALIDYAYLKADIKLIAESDSAHSGLYDELVTNGNIESFASQLPSVLTSLETMPVSSAQVPDLLPNSQTGLLVADIDALSDQGDALIAADQDFPLVDAPVSLLQAMNTKLTDTDYNQSNQSIAWLLFMPQWEIDEVDMARDRLDRTRDQVIGIYVWPPEQLIARFFFEALFLSPRITQAEQDLDSGIPTGIGPEIKEIHDKLQMGMSLVAQRGIQLTPGLTNLYNNTIVGLADKHREITGRMDLFIAASTPPAPSSPPVSSPPLVLPPPSTPPLATSSPVVQAPTSPPSSSFSSLTNMVGSAPQVPLSTVEKDALEFSINETLRKVQKEVIEKENQIKLALAQKDNAAVARVIKPNIASPVDTQVIARAVQSVANDRTGIVPKTLDSAVNRVLTQDRLVNKSTVFTDSNQLGIHRDAVETLYGVGLIKGNPDGSFKPNKELNRAEMMTLVVNAAYGTEFKAYQKGGGYLGGNECFSDIPDGAWYEDVVCFGAEQGVVQGYLDGSFQPGKPVNFVEGQRIAIAAFQLPVNSVGASSTADRQWFSNDLDYSRSNGMLPADYTRPDAPLTRGQMASMLARGVVLAQQDVIEDVASDSSVPPALGHLPLKGESELSDFDKIIAVWDFRDEVKPLKPVNLEEQRADRLIQAVEKYDRLGESDRNYVDGVLDRTGDEIVLRNPERVLNEIFDSRKVSSLSREKRDILVRSFHDLSGKKKEGDLSFEIPKNPDRASSELGADFEHTQKPPVVLNPGTPEEDCWDPDEFSNSCDLAFHESAVHKKKLLEKKLKEKEKKVSVIEKEIDRIEAPVKMSAALRRFKPLIGQMRVTVSLFGKSPYNVELLKKAKVFSDQGNLHGISDKKILELTREIQNLMKQLRKEQDPGQYLDVNINQFFEEENSVLFQPSLPSELNEGIVDDECGGLISCDSVSVSESIDVAKKTVRISGAEGSVWVFLNPQNDSEFDSSDVWVKVRRDTEFKVSDSTLLGGGLEVDTWGLVVYPDGGALLGVDIDSVFSFDSDRYDRSNWEGIVVERSKRGTVLDPLKKLNEVDVHGVAPDDVKKEVSDIEQEWQKELDRKKLLEQQIIESVQRDLSIFLKTEHEKKAEQRKIVDLKSEGLSEKQIQAELEASQAGSDVSGEKVLDSQVEKEGFSDVSGEVDPQIQKELDYERQRAVKLEREREINAERELESLKRVELERLKVMQQQNEDIEADGLKLQGLSLLNEFDLLYSQFVRSIRLDSYFLYEKGRALYGLAHKVGVAESRLSLYMSQLRSLMKELGVGSIFSNQTRKVLGVQLFRDHTQLRYERQLDLLQRRLDSERLADEQRKQVEPKVRLLQRKLNLD